MTTDPYVAVEQALALMAPGQRPRPPDRRAARPMTALDQQHPRKPDGRWMAHCCVCGEYLEDFAVEPPADLLCDACEEDA